MKARVYWRNIRVDWGLGSTMQFEIKLDISSVHMMMDMSSCKCLHVKVFVLLYFFLSCLCVDKQKCIIIIIIIIIISSSSDNINGTQILRFGTYLGFNVTVRYDFGTAGGKSKLFFLYI